METVIVEVKSYRVVYSEERVIKYFFFEGGSAIWDDFMEEV